MIEVVYISFALTFGLAVRKVGLPPLVGFLAAGFALNYLSVVLEIPSEVGPILHHLAHLGVLILLFTVGLKLKIKQVIQPEVIGGGLSHMAISVLIVMPGIYFFTGVDWNTALLLAIALAFSSTVLAAKILESKRELAAFHGRVAIGILIIQDLVALIVLSVWGGHTPSIWALLVLTLPFLRPVLHWLLDISGHDELLVLMGMLLAVVLGGAGFELVGLSPELGALLMGVLLSDHTRTQELSDSLWSLKEILLVGFFLQIGMSGLPDSQALLFAVVCGLLLPLKGMLFFFLLILFRLRARNAFLTALSLSAYSEFGLIVAAVVLPEWLVPLALTVALSFLVAAPLNRMAHPLFARFEEYLSRFETQESHPDEQAADLGDAKVMIIGMGRTGTAAYDFLRDRCALIGLDADPYKAQEQVAAGRNVVYTDAEDVNFWKDVDISNIEAVILAVDDIESKLIAARSIRGLGFRGPVVSHALYEDHVDRIVEAGADKTYLTMYEAGVGLAEHTWEALNPELAAEAKGEGGI